MNRNIFIEMPMNRYDTNTFFTDRALAEITKFGNIKRNPYERNLTIDEMVDMAQDSDIIMGGWGSPMLDLEHYKKMPNLKLYAYTAGGLKSVISADLVQTNLRIIGGNNVFAKSVAEGTLTYILASLRRLEKYSNIMREGGCQDGLFKNNGLIGKRVGIVGFGTVARYFSELLKWFDGELLICDEYITEDEAKKHNGRIVGIEEIFSTCDVVSIHAALTEKTKGMITRELLMMLKPDALFVNTARAKIIDEDSLFELLMEGRFFAALDVHEPPKDHPIRKNEKVLLTPHMAGPTLDGRELVVMELCKDIERWQKKEQLKHEFFVEKIWR